MSRRTSGVTTIQLTVETKERLDRLREQRMRETGVQLTFDELIFQLVEGMAGPVKIVPQISIDYAGVAEAFNEYEQERLKLHGNETDEQLKERYESQPFSWSDAREIADWLMRKAMLEARAEGGEEYHEALRERREKTREAEPTRPKKARSTRRKK